jgi:hypothetical protein
MFALFSILGLPQGCVPVELAPAHPRLAGGGFELPAVEPVFSRYVASHGMSERLRFVPGDFFVDDLPRADVLIMGMILHDWDLPTKRMLIKKAYEALEHGGSLIVYEFLIDDERRTHLPGLLMSLNMLIETRGCFDYTGRLHGLDGRSRLHHLSCGAALLVSIAR